MKPKTKRLCFILLALSTFALGIGLVLYAFQQNLLYFYTPQQLLAVKEKDKPVRLGGLVVAGSISKENNTVQFRVTDESAQDIVVIFEGILPDLFREGQGVVAEGRLHQDGIFYATRILAKHDENYMPRELVKELKDTSRWQK